MNIVLLIAKKIRIFIVNFCVDNYNSLIATYTYDS